MPTTNDPISGDPLVSAHFKIDVPQLGISAFFLEMGGLGSETEVTDHKVMADGTKTPVIRKIPGRLKWGDITLKRGVTANMDFYKWRKMVEDGDVSSARCNGTIVMLDQTGGDIAKWEFEAGWPSKISGPSLKSDSNDIAVEELTIVHEGITRMQ